MKCLEVLPILFLLCSCSTTTAKFTFDGTTAISVQKSIKEYSNTLSKEKQKKFMAAVMRIAFDDLKLEENKEPLEI